eukprot:GILK01008649.1.p1 GENE.GILK01008649.1~~GILK01008649.1.p1  ORF type:complete len:1647 (-),score=313.75 GILK01008649.1:294-5174(-)
MEDLDDPSSEKRLDAIEQLRSSVKRNGGQILVGNLKKLFGTLRQRLGDESWNVSSSCTQLLTEMIPGFGPDLESCFSIVLPALVENLADNKVVIRKASLQCLAAFVRRSRNLESVVNVIVRHGMEHDEPRVRQQSILALTSLLSLDSHLDPKRVLDALLIRLRDTNDQVVQATEQVLGAIQSGTEEFPLYIKKLSYNMQQLYQKHAENIRKCSLKTSAAPLEGVSHVSAYPPPNFGTGSTGSSSINTINGSAIIGSGGGESVPRRGVPTLESTLVSFGFLPSYLVEQLKDVNNWKLRSVAIEELQAKVNFLTDAKNVLPFLPSFLAFVNGLLADPNFKISLTTLQIIGELVERIGSGLKPHLHVLLTGLVEKLGDNKIVIRQASMKVFAKILQSIGFEPILGCLYVSLEHKNWHVREEMLGVLIMALSAQPIEDFDLVALIQKLVLCVTDSKPKVKFVAMETFAVLANLLGAQRVLLMISNLVDSETRQALTERFTIQLTPVITSDGLVEYPFSPAPSPSLSNSLSVSSVASSPSNTNLTYTANSLTAPTGQSKYPSSPIPSVVESTSRLNSVRKSQWDSGQPQTTSQVNSHSGQSSKDREVPKLDVNFESAYLDFDTYERTLFQDFDIPMTNRSTVSELDHESLLSPPSDFSGSKLNLVLPVASPRRPGAGPHPSRRSSIPEMDPSPANCLDNGPVESSGHGGPAKEAESKEKEKIKLWLPENVSVSPRPYAPQQTQAEYVPTFTQRAPRRPQSAARNTAVTSSSRFQPAPQNGYCNGLQPRSEEDGGQHSSEEETEGKDTELTFDSGRESVASSVSPFGSRLSLLSSASPVNEPGKLFTNGSKKPMLSLLGGSALNSEEKDAQISPKDIADKLQILKRHSRTRSANATRDGQPTLIQRRVFSAGGSNLHKQLSHKLTNQLAASGQHLQGEDVCEDDNEDDRQTEENGRDAFLAFPDSSNSPLNLSVNSTLSLQSHHSVASSSSYYSANSANSPVFHSPMSSFSSQSSMDALKPPFPARKTVSNPKSIPLAREATPSSSTEQNYLTFDELRPLVNPELELKRLSVDLKEGDWMKQFEALSTVRRIVAHHTNVLGTAQLHAVTLEVLIHVDSLRSSLARNAMLCMADMFSCLKRQMDADLDQVVPVLLKRAADTNTFIAEEAEKAMLAMTQCVSENRALGSLLNCSGNRNVVAKAKIASYLERVVERMGPRIAQCKDLDRLVQVTTQLLSEGSSEIRTASKRCLVMLSKCMPSSAEFDRTLHRLLSDSAYNKVKAVIDKADSIAPREGFFITNSSNSSNSNNGNNGTTGGPPPTGMAKRANTKSLSSPSMLNGNLRTVEGVSNGLVVGRAEPSPLSRGDSPSAGTAEDPMLGLQIRRPVGGNSVAASSRTKMSASHFTAKVAENDPPELESFTVIYSNMGCNDWRLRHEAIANAIELLDKYPDAMLSRLVQFFDHFTQRLNDVNSKVNLFALQSLLKVVPLFQDALESVLLTLVPALANNLAASNVNIRAVTGDVFDCLIAHVDNTTLLQSFTHIVVHGNQRVRPVMLEKVIDLVEPVHSKKPALILKHVLPVAFRLLDETKGEIRTVNIRLILTLHAFLGGILMEQAQSLPPQKLQKLREHLFTR